MWKTCLYAMGDRIENPICTLESEDMVMQSR